MARPVSDMITVKFRLPKTLVVDLDEMHWSLRAETNDIVRDALVEYLARKAPKSAE